MNKILILSIIISSNLIFSCTNLISTSSQQVSSSPSSNYDNNTLSVTPSPLSLNPTPTATPTYSSPYTGSCLGITDTGKKFSVKCQYLILMSGRIIEKGSKKGLKSTIKFENSKGVFILNTNDEGYYEVTNLGTPDKLDEKTGLYEYNFKITISSKGYLDLNKELNYCSDSSLPLSNPIDFELETIRII